MRHALALVVHEYRVRAERTGRLDPPTADRALGDKRAIELLNGDPLRSESRALIGRPRRGRPTSAPRAATQSCDARLDPQEESTSSRSIPATPVEADLSAIRYRISASAVRWRTTKL